MTCRLLPGIYHNIFAVLPQMDEGDKHLEDSQLAPRACSSCFRQKRKCDKRLPACSLCLRLGRSCDYTADTQATPPSAEDFTALRQQISDLQSLIVSQGGNASPLGLAKVDRDQNANSANRNGSNNNPSSRYSPEWLPSTRLSPPSFPSLYFLDSNFFRYTGASVKSPHITVPPPALEALGNASELREMVEHYFDTAHTYLPVISKIRLYQHLADPVHEPDAALALLFLAMKLICNRVPAEQSPLTMLYHDVKSLYRFVESHNGFSVQLIQAAVLIALYETGHCIYPAAYLSIGNVARVGYACGLHDEKAPQILPQPTTWTEQEERRRLWWGITILDRFINIGNRGKSFATMDPSIDSHLPTDDSAWDRGQMLVAAPLSLSASPTVAASPFARTCQAAYLLGKALRHIDESTLPIEYRFDDAFQLHRTMRAFVDAVEYGGTPEDAMFSHPGPLSGSIAIILSALLTVYDAYSCTSTAPLGGGERRLLMQKESIEGLRSVSDRVLALVRRLRLGVQTEDLDRVSPFLIDAVYQAAANYAWIVRESSDAICSERLTELKEVLQILRGRWKVAGEYHRIVEPWQFSPITTGSSGVGAK